MLDLRKRFYLEEANETVETSVGVEVDVPCEELSIAKLSSKEIQYKLNRSG